MDSYYRAFIWSSKAWYAEYLKDEKKRMMYLSGFSTPKAGLAVKCVWSGKNFVENKHLASSCMTMRGKFCQPSKTL